MVKIHICKEHNCHNAVTSSGYCRLHFLKNWKRLKREEQLRSMKKLNRYIEHMMKRHPERYVEAIKTDLRDPRFERTVNEQFGFEEDSEDGLFNEPTFDEEVRELVERLKKSGE